MGSMKHPKYRLLKKTNGKSSPFYSFFKYIYIIWIHSFSCCSFHQDIHFIPWDILIVVGLISPFLSGWSLHQPQAYGLIRLANLPGLLMGKFKFSTASEDRCLKFQWLTFWKLWHWWQFANWNLAHRNSWFTELKDGGPFHSYVNVYQGVNPIRSH